jgi:hypothetical protein
MSYSKFGSIENSEVTLATVNEVVTFAVNENNKRIKLTSSGLDDVSSGYNLISENPLSGPEMTLRSLVAGPGIQLSKLGDGDKLLVTNTYDESGVSGNSNTIHTSGTLSTITFGFLFNRGPSGSIEPEFLALPRDINLQEVIDRTTTTPGVNWRFNQIGFDCALTIAPFALGQLSAGGTIQPSWALGFAEYNAGFGIFPVDYLFRLTIAGLPTVSKPVASQLNVQLGTFPITAYHVHTVSGTTGPPSSGAVINHTHTYATYSAEKEMTTSLGVSIHSFDEVNGTMVLYLRNLSPSNLGIINLLSILLTSTFSLTWTAVGAVDGSLNPDTSGSILAVNGITANTNVMGRFESGESALAFTIGRIDNIIMPVIDDFGTFTTYVGGQVANINTAVQTEVKTRADADVALTASIATKANSADVYPKTQTYTQAEVKALNDAQDVVTATKAPLNDPTFTGTVSGITKTMVGLAQVDNTSDANKPISAAGITKNNSQDTLISALQQVPYATVMHAVKSYVFQGAVARALDATGVQSSLVAGANFPFFTFSQPEGYLITAWTGTRYCNVLAQINFQYTNGANDNQVQIWLHRVGTTLPGPTPTAATAVGSASVGGAFSYVVVRSTANAWFTAQFNAILPLVGGQYYTMAMQCANGITYNVTGLLSLQTLYGV